MPQSGNFVMSRMEEDGHPSLFMFSLKYGKVKETNKLSLPCGHKTVAYLHSLIINGREQLVVCCGRCTDLKVVDLQTGEWSTAFQDCYPSDICLGGNGRVFVQSQWDSAAILELDSDDFVFKGPIRTLYPGRICSPLCYIPLPVDALVLSYGHKLVAMSVDKKMKVIWEISGKCNDFKFDPAHNVLLVADEIEETVLIVNPENGSLIQTIKLPNMGYIHALDLYKNELVMFHSNNTFNISYFNLL